MAASHHLWILRGNSATEDEQENIDEQVLEWSIWFEMKFNAIKMQVPAQIFR